MEFEIRPQNRFSFGLREIWDYRELFYFFALRDVKVKYKQTVLGILWVVLQPLLMALVFTGLLGKAIASYSGLSMPYDIFVLSGLTLWSIFSSGLNNAGNSMVSNSNIIKKIYFPRLIIPASAVLTSLFDFLIALIVFVVYAYVSGTHLNTRAVYLIPAATLLAAFTTFGAGTLLSALNVKYRDFRYVIPFLVQFVLFVSPVIYPISFPNNEFLQTLANCNPMAASLDLFRKSLTGEPIEAAVLFPGLITCALLFLTGLVYFRRTEAYFADIA